MNNQKPVFSVVMPMYNVEKYIAKAIHSVLVQRYSNFELICVDDGCTDRSVEIVKQFDDPRIRIVQQKNRGLAAARNTGINQCRGLYIAFLDSDDLWHPEKLLRHFEHFRSNPNIGVSYSASEFINEAGEKMGIGQYPKLNNVTPVDIFCRNPIGNGSAAVFRHSVLLKVSQCQGDRVTYFDESMRQSEDVEFWLRVALTTPWQFAGLAQPLTLYRVNSSGLSANLERQLEAWEYAVKKNNTLNSVFFEQWYPLALAYQKRYLARRAVQSRNGKTAVKLIHSALKSDLRILWQEPKRTLITYLCSFLVLLPQAMYAPLEKMAMRRMAIRKQPEA